MQSESLRYSVKQGNIYHIPTMPYRLAFAVVVRKAIAELETISGSLNRRDVVAVALPEMMKQAALDTSAEWQGTERPPQSGNLGGFKNPHLKAVLVGKKDGIREAFILTPSDGLMEAIRLAVERDIPLEFVNPQAPGGNLGPSPCAPNPDMWADNWLAVTFGLSDYLDLTREVVEQNPWRQEPLASWQERHMAGKLQELSAQYNRVVHVSFLRHHRALAMLLREPDLGSGPPEAPKDVQNVEVSEILAITTVVQALDDFPKVTQCYEEERCLGRAASFDKLNWLINKVVEFCRNFGLPWRRFQAFETMLPGVCAEGGRVTPRMREVVQVGEACFPEKAIAPMRNYLLTFFDTITLTRAEQIGPEVRQN